MQKVHFRLTAPLKKVFSSLRKHTFLLALRRWGRFAGEEPPRETSPAAKSEEKRMFSQAKYLLKLPNFGLINHQ